MSIIAIPTLAGQAALAAAVNGEEPLTIAEMVIGDGNGNSVTPLETQSGLVNLRATVPISNSVRDGQMVTFNAIIDENTGGFTIREAGLLNEDGVLLFVASTPNTEKLTTADNVLDILTLGLRVVVSDTASITLSPPATSLVSVAQMIRAPFISVDDFLTVAPTTPAEGATYVIVAGATGVWAGHDNQLAQWNSEAWVFKAVPVSHLVGVSSTSRYFRRTVSGWTEVILSDIPSHPFASIPEHLAGLIENKKTHPKGVQAMINAASDSIQIATLARLLGRRNFFNTSGGPQTWNLPSAPADGQIVQVFDVGGYFGTNPLTIGRNGKKIWNAAENLICNRSNIAVELQYVETNGDWKVTELFRSAVK